MHTNDIIEILLLICLLVLSGFFSSAETAMTTASRIRIRSLAEQGDKRASTMLRIMDESEKMLSAILIGNNIVNISASSLTATLTMRLFGSRAVGIATGILTLLVLVFGEITPKTLASVSAERISVLYAPVIWGMMKIMTPLIILVERLAGLVLRLFHIHPGMHTDTLTEEELRTLVDVGHEDGVLEEQEHQMITNVFDFGDSLVRDVMVPKAGMVSVSSEAGYDTVLQLFRRDKFTRLPVYEEDPDNIIGVLNIKDFFLEDFGDGFSVKKLMYEPHFTYENKKAAELFLEMQEHSLPLTIVLDEYGTTAGMVTMEDLLEELVGEIRDEYDEDEKDLIRQTGPDTWLIEGSMKLDDVNNALDLSLESPDYDSIGGYVIGRLDHLPEEGEEVTTEGGDTLRVEKMIRNRIDKILLQRIGSAADDTPQPDPENG